MEIYINKCSKCGSEARSDTEKEKFNKYVTANIKFGKTSYSEYGDWTTYENKNIYCEDCIKALGFVVVS